MSLFYSIKNSFFAVMPYILRIGIKYKESTEQYPDVVSSRMASDLYPRSKGFLINDLDVCNGCNECVVNCPAQALNMKSSVLASGKVTVDVFEIDFTKCVYCSICVEVCPVNSINYTKEFEGAGYQREDLLLRLQKGSEPYKTKASIMKEKVSHIRFYEVRR